MERIHIINILYRLPEEVKHFAMLTILRYIIYSSINIFLPAYIIYAYDLKTSLLYLALQYFFIHTFISISFFRKLTSKYSAEMIQIISTIFGVIGIVAVFLIKNIVGIVISAFLLNLNFTLYWLSKHYIIVRYAKKEDEMEESVIVDSIGRIAYFITPILSSYIIYRLGYPMYYAITTFVILSIIAYIISKTKKKRTYLHSRERIQFKYKLLFFLEGVIGSGWLLTTTAFLFYNLNTNIKFYGILKGISQIVIIALSFYIAKTIDKKHNLKISIISLILLAISFYLYIVLKDNMYILSVIVTLISLFYNLGSISPSAFLYEYAKTIDSGIILGREFLLTLSRFSILFLSIYYQEIIYVVAVLTVIYVFIFYEIAIKHKHLL